LNVLPSTDDYKIDLLPLLAPTRGKNPLRLTGATTQDLMLRLYSGDLSLKLTPQDLPKIYAYDAATGKDAKCPETSTVSVSITPPVEYAKPGDVLPFTIVPVVPFGPNAAVPNYVTASAKLSTDTISVFKFLAPSAAESYVVSELTPPSTDVRYWSICIAEPKYNVAMGCLPDYLAKTSADGFVRVVFGVEAMRKQAESLGYNFIRDDRTARSADDISVVYRNLLPSEEFNLNRMYQGPYLPIGVVCRSSDLGSPNCQ
jgi:hypothetical protein